MEAKNVLDNANSKFEYYVRIKNYNMAYCLSVDMYYISLMLEEKFGQNVDEGMFQIFRNKATCLYYMV